MSTQPINSPIFLFGGTFNPVHYGHLRLVENLHNLMPEAVVRMMPSATPPHRDAPDVSAEHRLNMVRLATQSMNHVVVDDRELKRQGPSYTSLSIDELATEYPNTAKILVMGDDAMAGFQSWHRWQDIIQQANILVIARPGATQQWLAAEVEPLIIRCDSVESLLCSDAVGSESRATLPPTQASKASATTGRLYRYQCPLLDISATQIRQLITRQKSCRFLLPDSVIKYIEQYRLYH